MRVSLAAAVGAGFLVASLSGVVMATAPNAVAVPDPTTSGSAGAETARSESGGDEAADGSDPGIATEAQGDVDDGAVGGEGQPAGGEQELAEAAEQESNDDVALEPADDAEPDYTDAAPDFTEAEPEVTDGGDQESTAPGQGSATIEGSAAVDEQAAGADSADDHSGIAEARTTAAIDAGNPGPATGEQSAPAAEVGDLEPGTAAEPAAPEDPAAPDTAREAAAPDSIDGDAAAADPAESASVPLEATTQPPRPTLLNLVGSVVVNLLIGLVQLIDGPPVVPANSPVTVRTSSLNLPIGRGRSVQADWYFPAEVDDETRFTYLQHGFFASGPMYSVTAADLAQRTNSIVVAPSLSSNFFAPDAAWVGGSTMHRAVADLFVGDRTALNESASAAAGYDVVLPDEFVLVGHSAGGTLVTAAAGHMTDNGAIDDLAGIVMLDGVEPAGSRLVSDALAKLTGDHYRPIYLMSSERYFWNRGGDMADKVQSARPDSFNGVGLDGGLHVDYMVGGNPLIQLAQYVVTGFSRAENVDAAGLITAGWVTDMFAGTAAEGIYGLPGLQLTVDTPSGVATATVLPLGRPDRPVWPPLFDAALTAVFDFAGRYLFVYEPLRGFEPMPTTSAA